jgi:hypothetical protein
MKKYLHLLIIVITLFSCHINKNIYKPADFDDKSGAVKTVAVLPFNLTSTGYRPKNVTEQDIRLANEKWGYTFQESLYSYLLFHCSKKKKGPITQFQALQQTNALLKEQNISIGDLYSKTPEAVAKLLGVDAIILTTLDQHKNMSDGAAYGIYAARTILNAATTKGAPLGSSIPSDNIKMNSYLYDHNKGDLLWKTFRQGSTDLPANREGQIDFFTNWIAKKFPYRS